MARKPDPSIRERILRDAECLIHLHGYQGTSLDVIARRLKMTKANLLHHFRSKEELGLAVLDFKADVFFKECLEPIFRDERDPARAVDALFRRTACFLAGNGCRAGCFVGNIALEMSDVSDRFRERVGRFFERWVSLLAPSLTRGQAEAVVALYEGAIMQARARRDPSVFERVGREARRLVESRRRTIA